MHVKRRQPLPSAELWSGPLHGQPAACWPRRSAWSYEASPSRLTTTVLMWHGLTMNLLMGWFLSSNYRVMDCFDFPVSYQPNGTKRFAEQIGGAQKGQLVN